MDVMGMESVDPRIKKGLSRIFTSANEDLATSLVK